MSQKTLITISILITLSLSGLVLAQDNVMFNYQGRVKVHGLAFTGTGQFKFAIINNAGSESLWSNDNTSVSGGEPTASISISVTDGIFNVMVGDPGLGMSLINRSIFNHPDQIKLRIWFSDGTHGFQQLLPDHNLVNVDLLGMTSGSVDFTIYVNGTTGNDEHNGLSPGKAKETIQAAVDVLPNHVNCNVTIDIADGVYREKVIVNGINVKNGKTLTLLGDESWTPSSLGDPLVRITGNDDDITNIKIRDCCIIVQASSNISLRGLLIDNASDPGVWGLQGFFRIANCKAVNNKYGFSVGYSSFIEFSNCIANDNVVGFRVVRNSFTDIVSCRASNNTSYGVWLDEFTAGHFYGTGTFSNNSIGILVQDKAKAEFMSGYTGNIQNNTQYGIRLRFESYSKYHTLNSFSGNGQDIEAIEGSASYI